MALSLVRWDGYALLVKKLEGIADLDYTPLMMEWRDLIVEDNRAKVLSGLDKFGNPAPPLHYRTGHGVKTRFRPRENPIKNRTGSRLGYFGETRGRFKGKDIARGKKILPNNNLTTATYQEMTGPYGAPRRESSRIISNLVGVDAYHDGVNWFAECEWRDVLDPNGRPFLQHMFKRYPIDGVRPVGKEKARKLMRAFVKDAMKGP